VSNILLLNLHFKKEGTLITHWAAFPHAWSLYQVLHSLCFYIRCQSKSFTTDPTQLFTFSWKGTTKFVFHQAGPTEMLSQRHELFIFSYEWDSLAFAFYSLILWFCGIMQVETQAYVSLLCLSMLPFLSCDIWLNSSMAKRFGIGFALSGFGATTRNHQANKRYACRGSRVGAVELNSTKTTIASSFRTWCGIP